MNFNVREGGGVEARDFFVAQVGIGLREFFVEILIDAEDGGARGVAGEIFVAIFFAEEQGGGLAFGVGCGESDPGADESVAGEVIGGFAFDADEFCFGDGGDQRIGRVGIGGAGRRAW